MMSEEKMQIVINNYFKSECSVDTSIRQAFEKGFRIGLKKGLSAQPEQRWIPVTERLPKIGEKVLVSTKYTVFTQVFKRIYGTPDRWGWEHNTIKKVSAWMPLPEPWKGEQKGEQE